MSTLVTLAYKVEATGLPVATVKAMMDASAAPVPADVLSALGLRVTSDLTTNVSSLITRTIILALGPSMTATATAALEPNGDGVASFAVTAPGADYIQPPEVVITGGGAGGLSPGDLPPQPLNQRNPANQAVAGVLARGRAFLNVQAANVGAGGAAYSGSTTIGFVGGLPPALFLQEQQENNEYASPSVAPAVNGPPYALNGISMIQTGRRYGATTYIEIQGGNIAAGGHPAKAIISAFGPNGEILAVQVVDPGAGYQGIPDVIFIDPAATAAPQNQNPDQAAKACALMGAGTPATATLTIVGNAVTAVVMSTNGDGYVGVPQAVIYDPTGAGSGAAVTASMGLGSIKVQRPGKGYISTPTVTLLPFFKGLFPDSGDQRAPVWNLMSSLIKKNVASTATALAPTLS